MQPLGAVREQQTQSHHLLDSALQGPGGGGSRAMVTQMKACVCPSEVLDQGSYAPSLINQLNAFLPCVFPTHVGPHILRDVVFHVFILCKVRLCSRFCAHGPKFNFKLSHLKGCAAKVGNALESCYCRSLQDKFQRGLRTQLSKCAFPDYGPNSMLC